MQPGKKLHSSELRADTGLRRYSASTAWRLPLFRHVVVSDTERQATTQPRRFSILAPRHMLARCVNLASRSVIQPLAALGLGL